MDSEKKPPASGLKTLYAVSLAAASGILSAMAFAPFGFTGLVWVSLIPWLYCLPRLTLIQTLVCYITFASGYFLIGLFFLTSVHPLAPLALLLPLLVMCLPFPLLYRWVVRELKLPAILVAPVIWVATDYFRMFLFTGCPWLYLGYTQAFYPALIQIADITGTYGVTFLIVMVNGSVLDWFEWYLATGAARPKVRRLLAGTASVVLLLVATLVYGQWRLQTISYVTGPRIACVQGNIPQDIKDDPRENRQRILEAYTTLSVKAMEQKPELLVWPETMAPYDLKLDFSTLAMFRDLVKLSGTHLLIGSHHYDFDDQAKLVKSYNSAYFLNPAGEFLDRYDKMKLMILGEYTPKIPVVHTIVRKLAGYVSGLSSGERATVFQLGQYRFGTPICLEIIYPAIARTFAREGCDFIINLTNEGWFFDTSEQEQILAIAVFRAVENRIGVLRAGNTGITLNIAPDGRLRKEQILTIPHAQYFASLPPFMQVRLAGRRLPGWDVAFGGERLKWKDFPGIFCQAVPLATGPRSWYTRYGDLFAQIVSAIALLWCAIIGKEAYVQRCRQADRTKSQ